MPPRIWAFVSDHVGDNGQVLALAEELGLPFDVKPLRYTWLKRLPGNNGRVSLLSLDSASRKQIEPLAQGHVYALKPTRDRRSDWTLQSHPRRFKGFDHIGGKHLPRFGDDVCVQIYAEPFDRSSCSVNRPHSGLGNFGPDPVTGDQRNWMRHSYHCREWPLSSER